MGVVLHMNTSVEYTDTTDTTRQDTIKTRYETSEER